MPPLTRSKPLFLLLLFSAALPLLSGAAAAEDGTVTVTFSANPYEIKNTPEGHELFMEGFGRYLVPGKPNLPARIFAVAVPPLARVTGVSIEKGEEVILPGFFRIAPCPLPRVTGEEDPACYARDLALYKANFESVYGRDEPYPGEAGAFLLQGSYRKYNLADVRITPFTYSPRSGRLAYYPEITVHVHYTLPEVIDEDAVIRDHLPRTEKVAQKILYNYDQAQAWFPGIRPLGGRGLYDFVIITLSHLTSAVQPLVDFETAKGRTVKVVTAGWISYNYPGYDLQEKMRNFLRDKYPSEAWGIEDVCLVGDFQDLPLRRTAQDVGYGAPETDFYYAELSYPDHQSWDLDGDHLWGEDEDPNDFYGEVNTGRIPWSDPDTVEHICRKSVAFEMTNDPNFKKNALLLGSYFWEDTDNAVLMELKTDPARCPWMSEWTSTKLYEQNSTVYSPYPCDEDLCNRNTVAAWTTGQYAFVNMAGHGNPYGVYMMGYASGYFIMGQDCTLLDDRYPSIVFANACSTSDTDLSPNLGQLMLKQGAVGYLGATKVSFGYHGWNDPYYYGCSSSMDYFFSENVTSALYTQGESLQRALSHMYAYGLFYYEKYELFEWSSIFGNPDLGLSLHAPLTVSFPEGVPQGSRLPGGETKILLEIQPGQESYTAGSGLLHFRFDPLDPFSTAGFKSLGNGYYEATLPETQPGDAPEFYFTLQGSSGSTVSIPYDAPEDKYALDLRWMEVVEEDGFETDSGWTMEDDNVDANGWEWAEPGATSIQPGEDYTEDGTLCFVTGSYPEDTRGSRLQGGPTHLISPALDLSAGDLEIGFHLWFIHSHYGTQQPLEIHLSNDNGNTWTKALDVLHSPGWNLQTIRVSDYVAPTAAVRVRFTAIDNPHDDYVEALLDDFMIFRWKDAPPLWAKRYAFSAAAGGSVDFQMDAGPGNGNRPYVLLGSVSGTTPGYTLPDGTVLPIYWDRFTDFVLRNLGAPFFQSFAGQLDASGAASATFSTQGPVNPNAVGVELSFAFAAYHWPYYASNAVTVTVVQ